MCGRRHLRGQEIPVVPWALAAPLALERVLVWTVQKVLAKGLSAGVLDWAEVAENDHLQCEMSQKIAMGKGEV